MKNGTLVINNNAGFQEDIWQTHEEWERTKWDESTKYQAETLQKLYNQLCETEEYGGGCEELYVLGDVINMLNSIDVEIKMEETKMEFKCICFELKDGWSDTVFVTEETVDRAIQNIKDMYGNTVKYIDVYDSEIKEGYLVNVINSAKCVYRDK